MSVPNPDTQAAAAAAPDDARPRSTVHVVVKGLWRDHDVEVDFNLPASQISEALRKLERYGLRARPRPVVWNLTPEGLPICGKHGVPMKSREKQGDTWHSHKVVASDGTELYCRGYAGPESPGYSVPRGATDAEDLP